jgi:hypothetical protein
MQALQNLSAGVEGEKINLTLLMVFFIARGYATWLSRKLEVPTQSLRVSIGTDSRISGLAVRCAICIPFSVNCE